MPEFSIIIPHKDQNHLLPRLFESIRRQSFMRHSAQCVEVLVIDDHSAEPLDAMIAEQSCRWSRADMTGKQGLGGLQIRLVTPEKSLTVWQRRILGVQTAATDTIVFADADDVFWGTEGLWQNVCLLQQSKADIVHHRTLLIDNTLNFNGYCTYHDPFAQSLTGQDIFSTYVCKGFRGDPLWTKVFSKSVWGGLEEITQGSAIGNLHEDAFLTTLLLHRAKTYIGSDMPAYAHIHEIKVERHPARMVENYLIAKELGEYLAKNNCPPELLEKVMHRYRKRMCVQAGQFCLHLTESKGFDLDDAEIEEFLCGVDRHSFFKALLIGNRLNAAKIKASVKNLL